MEDYSSSESGVALGPTARVPRVADGIPLFPMLEIHLLSNEATERSRNRYTHYCFVRIVSLLRNGPTAAPPPIALLYKELRASQ